MDRFNPSGNQSLLMRVKRIYTEGDAVVKIIFIYAVLFALSFFAPRNFWVSNFYLTAVESVLFKPWKWITYSFFFDSFFDLIFKCYLLYQVSSIFKRSFDASLLLKIYFTGIIFGGLSFGILSNLPVYQDDYYIILSGNATGILAVFSAFCHHNSNQPLQIFGNFSVKSLHLLIGVLIFISFGERMIHVLVYVLSALSGKIYMILYYKGTDLAAPVELFIQRFFRKR